MNIFCLGISHRTAPIEIREKLWFSDDEIRTVLPRLKEMPLKEVVLVSTCNRTELYCIPNAPDTNGEPLWRTLAGFKNTGTAVHDKHFYTHS